MDRTSLIIKYLNDWQNKNIQNVCTSEDVVVFNTIGQIITLLDMGLMTISKLYYLISDILELSDKEKELVYKIISDAFTEANKGKDGIND